MKFGRWWKNLLSRTLQLHIVFAAVFTNPRIFAPIEEASTDHVTDVWEAGLFAVGDYVLAQIVVVDDGSTQADAMQYLQELQLKFAAKGWFFRRQENRGPGAARNHAAQLATGAPLPPPLGLSGRRSAVDETE